MFQCEADPDTLAPTENFTEQTIEWCKSIGSSATKVPLAIKCSILVWSCLMSMIYLYRVRTLSVLFCINQFCAHIVRYQIYLTVKMRLLPKQSKKESTRLIPRANQMPKELPNLRFCQQTLALLVESQVSADCFSFVTFCEGCKVYYAMNNQNDYSVIVSHASFQNVCFALKCATVYCTEYLAAIMVCVSE